MTNDPQPQPPAQNSGEKAYWNGCCLVCRKPLPGSSLKVCPDCRRKPSPAQNPSVVGKEFLTFGKGADDPIQVLSPAQNSGEEKCDEDSLCQRCHAHMQIPFGMEPTPICNSCAQQLVYEKNIWPPSPQPEPASFELANARADRHPISQPEPAKCPKPEPAKKKCAAEFGTGLECRCDVPHEPKTEPAKGEWRVGAAFHDGRWHCKIFDDNDSVALGSGKTKEEAQQIAAQIVEDHNSVERFRENAETAHAIFSADQSEISSLLQERDRQRTELNRIMLLLSEAVTERDRLKGEVESYRKLELLRSERAAKTMHEKPMDLMEKEQPNLLKKLGEVMAERDEWKRLYHSQEQKSKSNEALLLRIDELKAELEKAQPAIDFCKGAFNETLQLLNLSEHPTLIPLCEENQKMRAQCEKLSKQNTEYLTAFSSAEREVQELKAELLRGKE